MNLNPASNYEEVVSLSPNQVLPMSISAVPDRTGYILFQAHAHLFNVTLSLNSALNPGEFTTGYNIGVVVTPPASSAYVRNDHENVTVEVLLMAQIYDENGNNLIFRQQLKLTNDFKLNGV